MSDDRYIARQPIFNANTEIVAYELLFRSDFDNYCKAGDAVQASSSVITDSLLTFDLTLLTDGKGAFVNMPRESLLAEHARMLPPELTTIEVLETVEPDEAVIAACQQLKDDGYRLALDDFVDRPELAPLVALADVVKIDLLATPREQLGPLAARLRRPGLTLLAEKVETREDFDHAVSLGFTRFQGYFFAKPVILTGRTVPGFKAAYLELLKVINTEPFNIDRVEGILKRDVSISYKFLRYINSAAVGLRGTVSSIRETLILLGQRNIRTLASVWALAGLGQDRPEALLLVSVTRARFCEGLVQAAHRSHLEAEAFLLGMLSLIDAIMGRPMSQIVSDLPVSDAVRSALVDHTGPLYPILDCSIAYEQGDWESVTRLADAMGVAPDAIPQLYLDAIPADLRATIG